MVNEIAQGVVLGGAVFCLIGVGVLSFSQGEEAGCAFMVAGVVLAGLIFAWPYLTPFWQ